MRVIRKSEVREIIIGHVEFTLIFLFDDFLCKYAILEHLKVRFRTKNKNFCQTTVFVICSFIVCYVLIFFENYGEFTLFFNFLQNFHNFFGNLLMKFLRLVFVKLLFTCF